MEYFFARRISYNSFDCTCRCDCNKCKTVVVEKRSIAIQCSPADDDIIHLTGNETVVIEPAAITINKSPDSSSYLNVEDYLKRTNEIPPEILMNYEYDEQPSNVPDPVDDADDGIPRQLSATEDQLLLSDDFLYNDSSYSDSSETRSSHEDLFTLTPKYESIKGFIKVPDGYKCDKCQRVMGTISAYHMHSMSHTEHSRLCTICGVVAESNRKLLFHERIHRTRILHKYKKSKSLPIKNNKYHLCTECNVNFSNGTKLRLHNEINHIEKTLCCQECKQKFASEKRLRDHVQLYHIIQYKCQPCKLVLSKRGFDRHFKLTHSPNRSYSLNCTNIQTYFICSLCDKKYASQSDLSLHRHAWHRN